MILIMFQFQVQDDRCMLSGTVWTENKTSGEIDCLWTHIFGMYLHLFLTKFKIIYYLQYHIRVKFVLYSL